MDRGLITLDTDMRTLYPALDAAASRIFKGLDDSGAPSFEKNDKPILLAQMLNQSSGFGMEFGETVQEWKKVTDKGKGYVNSCRAVRRLSLLSFSPHHITQPVVDLSLILDWV